MAIAGKWARAKARQRIGCRSGVPWPAQALGVLAGIGCRRAPGLPPAWTVLAVLDHRQFGRAFVLSIGEAGNKATTAPGSSGSWWRSPASGPGRRRDSVPAADRACRGLWLWCRGAGNPRLPPAWSVLAVLDHRQFFRVFVLSIGEAAHEATTAPASSGSWWRSPTSGPMRTRDSAPAADRGCRGLWSWCRGVGKPRLPLAWPVLAALDHRQFGRAFVLSIGEAAHEATTAPGSSGSWWRSPASRPGRRREAHRLPIGVAVACGCGVGVWANRGCLRRGPCWRCSIIGSSAGASSSRSVKPATKRRRRQGRAVPGGDRRQVGQGEGETAYRLPIGRAVACSGSRGARSPAVRPGLRPLDR
ncbi:MAG: hypothetical protein IPK44_10310 [Candidatus Accumulibacter sp.]|uniref:hypothetical protein n=1 Tax=Accumulibacter sp. TaxID=2053492 RepID=UPI00258AD2C4|nr:hypothetical protein [Accumulibacter sp.]MBK8114895.1 hypothetical protein [Accumulibacter sp.]